MRASLSLLSLSALLGFASPALAGGGALAARLQPTPCVYELPSGFQEGRNASCAVLSVPERHDQPSARRLKLHVIRLHGTGKKRDPVVYLHGGPGGDVGWAVPALGAEFIAAAGGRDVVFLDQRGSGLSSPLTCKPTLTPERQLALQLEDDATFIREEVADHLACRDQVVRSGADLNAYNSAQIAADLESLRLALGATQLNLYGNSYGTRVAQEMLRRFPASVRSTVMDGPVPAGEVQEPSFGALFTRAAQATFDWCERDAGCRATYPNAAARFTETLGRLDREQVKATVMHPTLGSLEVPLSSGGLLGVLFGLMYDGESPLILPHRINPAYQGRYEELALWMAGQVKRDSAGASLLFMIELVNCADSPATRRFVEGAGRWPEVQRWSARAGAVSLNTCRALDLKADPLLAQPVTSATPTLILAGELDPITPPSYGRILVPRLKNSALVVFPRGGHGQAWRGDTSECTFQLMRNFWAQPGAKLDTSCVR